MDDNKRIKHVAVYSWSFDPPHLGHCECAASIAELKDVDEVWVVPVSDHPRKRNVASHGQRCEMVGLALEDVPKAKACKIESHEAVELIEKLEKEYPDCSFSLVMGADVLGRIYDFRGIGDFIDEGHEIIVSAPSDYQKPIPGLLRTVTARSAKSSSADIRNMLKKSGDISGLVPRKVLEYLRENKIYDGTFSGKLKSGDGVTAALLKKSGIKVVAYDG